MQKIKRARRPLIVIAVLLLGAWLNLQAVDPDSLAQQYYGKTADEISGLSSAGVKPTKTWFDQAIFNPLAAAFGKLQWEDTLTNVRNFVKYDDIRAAIYDDGTAPVSGKVTFPTYETAIVRDSTIYLGSNMMLEFNPGFTIDWYNADWTYCANPELFRAWGDSNIYIAGNGATFYGNSENYADVSGTLSDDDVNGDSLTFKVTGISVAADSMANWHCINVTESGQGYNNKEHNYVSSNTATSGGITTVTLKTKWDTLGVEGVDNIIFSPNNQWNHAIGLWGCKNVIIKDLNINNFGGDGINLIDTDSVLIDGVSIRTEMREFSEPMLIGRQGISLIYNGAGTEYGDGSACHPTGKEITADTTLKAIKITNCDIDGGYYAIDFEPNVVGGTIRDVIIDGNNITNDEGGGITTNTSIYLKNVVISNNIIDTEGYGVFLSSNSASYGIENMWIVNNDIRSNAGSAIYVRGHVKNLYIIGNTISSRDTTRNTNGIQLYNAVTNGEMTNVIIRDNTFFNLPNTPFIATNPGATSTMHNIEFSDNSIMNPGYRTPNVNGFINYAVYFAGCSKVNVTGNRIFETSGRDEYRRPFEFVGCDSLVVSDNVTYGARYSNSPAYWLCNNYYDVDNIYGYPGGTTSTGISTINIGYEVIHSSSNHVIKDTCVVDADSTVYYIQEFGSFGTDSVVYWITATTRDTILMSSTLTDTTIRVYNDTLFVFSSDSITADSISIRKYLYGTREDHGTFTDGDTLAGTEAITNEHWYTWLTYRDVIKPYTNIIGALLRVFNVGTYGRNAQRSVVELYVNDDSGLVGSTGDVARVFQAVGGKFMPDNLILPTGTTTVTLADTTQDITPVNGMMYVTIADSILHVYINGGWVSYSPD